MTPEERAAKAVDNLLRVDALGSADRRVEIEAEIARQIGEVSERRGSAIEYSLIAVLIVLFALHCSSLFE
jgi:hypothetical protein